MNALHNSANTDRCTLYKDLANFLKDERFTKKEYQTLANRFERWTPRTQESPSELARHSEANRKQAPQSEANVCRGRKYILKNLSLINCTGHPIMHRTPNVN